VLSAALPLGGPVAVLGGISCAEISACISAVMGCLFVRTVAVLGGSDRLVTYSLFAIRPLNGQGRDLCRSRRSRTCSVIFVYV
jgi:hypothetical protein